VRDILAEILANKRTEVEQAKRAVPLTQLQADPGYALPRRNFYGAVTAPQQYRPNLIAELKKASPSAGLIVPDFDPIAIARMYEEAGARALSILTDQRFFDGRLEYLALVKSAVALPVLRKDFIIDEYQLHESRAAGADAVLLIGEALEWEQVTRLVMLARQLELTVLGEVHTRDTLSAVLHAIPGRLREHVLLGINNRDLRTQTIDLDTTAHVAELAPPGLPIVSESGIRTRHDVERLHAAGARALLIGETLLRSPDPRQMIRQLFG